MIDRLRKPAAADLATEDTQTLTVPATGQSPAKLDPLVEALGLAVARNATRDRTLSAA